MALTQINCVVAAGSEPSSATSPVSIQQRCVVIIPALNEETTIGNVIVELRSRGFRRVIVVDNGSSDQTACRARLAGGEVVREPRRGYGRACLTALQRLPLDAEWILFCDGDGSSDLRDVEQLVIAAKRADFVLGDRTKNVTNRAAMTMAQRFGNALATTLMRWGWDHRYADLGPLRLIRRDALERMAMRDRGFGWTVDMQVRALELGLRIREVPVRYRPRQGGKSKISGTIIGTLRAGTVILTTIIALFARKVVRRSIVRRAKFPLPAAQFG